MTVIEIAHPHRRRALELGEIPRGRKIVFGDGLTTSTGGTYRPDAADAAPTVGDEAETAPRTTSAPEPEPDPDAPCVLIETPVIIVAGRPCPTSVIPPDLLEEPVSRLFRRLL